MNTSSRNNEFDLTGKVAMVTGAGRGMGAHIAHTLSRYGADLIICSRTGEELDKVAQKVKSEGRKVMTYPVDLTQVEAIPHMVEACEAEMGGIDILVNNAGIAAFGSFNEMDVSQWSQIIQTNLMGMYYVTKEVLPHLINKNEGDIFNVASTAGLNGNANTSAYSASKFAVIGMSESLMKEVRKNNIRVCTLTPSTIASDMSIELGIANKDSHDSVLQPEDFAELIVAGLKLPRRAMLKAASLWSTNP